MALGLSWEDYWRGDPMMVPAAREADRLRADRENRVAWLHGLYTYRAVAALAPTLNALSKSRRAREYPSPVTLDPQEAAREREARGIEYMRAMMDGRARTLREREARG